MKFRSYFLILLCAAAVLVLSSCQMMEKPKDETLFEAPPAVTEVPIAVTEIPITVTEAPEDMTQEVETNLPGGSSEPGLNG